MSASEGVFPPPVARGIRKPCHILSSRTAHCATQFWHDSGMVNTDRKSPKLPVVLPPLNPQSTRFIYFIYVHVFCKYILDGLLFIFFFYVNKLETEVDMKEMKMMIYKVI